MKNATCMLLSTATFLSGVNACFKVVMVAWNDLGDDHFVGSALLSGISY